MDLRELRNCFGQFATGVTVITWKDDQGERHGITVNSFTSVSLDPALVLVSIAKNAKACSGLKNRSFVINVLSESQESYAWQFAGRPDENLVVEWEESNGLPHLKNALATFECIPWAEYEGGDHILYVGKVEDFSYSDEEGLLFFRGKFIKKEMQQPAL
ncbi:flavin reductase family protein [Paenisporosarcina sp. OV554]|uniref:flavin reductase family protein n=1 Tax=Paenisporosarcina sp. OV554 TaxID=2135694 RepID=UPI000D33E827|nr:flavin reductase family protein [Paenisporosarcina sp. OV554]PUB11683.1 flavin reductase (DIM6/NTAB) family NADH-FMN oxidoreductase RutF [Paenisporosarcina sp. OV554]